MHKVGRLPWSGNKCVCCVSQTHYPRIYLSHSTAFTPLKTRLREHKVYQSFLFPFFKSIYFIFIAKSDVQGGGETERKIFHQMIHPPGDHNGWCCADPKQRSTSQELFLISHMGEESQGFGLSLTSFPGHKQEGGWEVELLWFEPPALWDPSVLKARTFVTRPSLQGPSIISLDDINMSPRNGALEGKRKN